MEERQDKRYTVQEVAGIFNISANKVRFYEKKGLLKPQRGENNYRYYGKADLVTLQMVLMYRAFNLSVEDIKKIMAASDAGDILEHLNNQWKMVNDSIHRLSLIRDSLGAVIDKVYDGTEEDLTEQILDIAGALSKVQDIKDNWMDQWDFDDWAKNYDTAIRVNEDSLGIYEDYDELLATVYEMASAQLDPGAEVLDIGVGTGNLSEKFLHSGYNVIGVDQSREMLSVAKSKLPALRLRLGEFLKLPFDRNRFDGIVTTLAFHHLNEEEKRLAIEEMIRVLKEEGIIVIGDLMFRDAGHKERFYKSCTAEQIQIIEDEYYANLEMLTETFEAYGKKVTWRQINELNYVVLVK